MQFLLQKQVVFSTLFDLLNPAYIACTCILKDMLACYDIYSKRAVDNLRTFFLPEICKPVKNLYASKIIFHYLLFRTQKAKLAPNAEADGDQVPPTHAPGIK